MTRLLDSQLSSPFLTKFGLLSRLLREVGRLPAFFLSVVRLLKVGVERGPMPGTDDRSRSEAIISQVWNLVEPVISAEGMELIEVEYRRESNGWVLRLFIDREDGVSVDDCAHMSRVAGDLLDVADLIFNPYQLEVSSPGLNRPLRKWEHFTKQLGKIIEVRTLEPIETRRNFTGILLDATAEWIKLNCDGQIFQLDMSLLERARLRYFESLESPRLPED